MNAQWIKEVFYEVSGDLERLYLQRRQTLLFQKLMWLITGVYLILMLLLVAANYVPLLEKNFPKFLIGSPTNPYVRSYPFIGLIVLLYFSTSFFIRKFQVFKIKESETIKKMVKQLFPKVDFAQNLAPPTKEIVKSKLFPWVQEEVPMYSYGQIRSKVNETLVNIADIGIIEKNVSNKLISALMQIPLFNVLVVLYQYVFKNMVSSKSADNVYFTFRGMFCWLQFKKKLKGHTVILPRSNMMKFDRVASFNFKEEQKIYLEDPRFTKEFIVYGTDQVEARYVLSSGLMERIVNLKQTFDQPILVSFQDQQMFMAVQNENGLFSFTSGKLDTVKIIEELAHDIETALEVATLLKL